MIAEKIGLMKEKIKPILIFYFLKETVIKACFSKNSEDFYSRLCVRTM